MNGLTDGQRTISQKMEALAEALRDVAAKEAQTSKTLAAFIGSNGSPAAAHSTLHSYDEAVPLAAHEHPEVPAVQSLPKTSHQPMAPPSPAPQGREQAPPTPFVSPAPAPGPATPAPKPSQQTERTGEEEIEALTSPARAQGTMSPHGKPSKQLVKWRGASLSGKTSLENSVATAVFALIAGDPNMQEYINSIQGGGGTAHRDDIVNYVVDLHPWLGEGGASALLQSKAILAFSRLQALIIPQRGTCRSLADFMDVCQLARDQFPDKLRFSPAPSSGSLTGKVASASFSSHLLALANSKPTPVAEAVAASIHRTAREKGLSEEGYRLRSLPTVLDVCFASGSPTEFSFARPGDFILDQTLSMYPIRVALAPLGGSEPKPPPKEALIHHMCVLITRDHAAEMPHLVTYARDIRAPSERYIRRSSTDGTELVSMGDLEGKLCRESPVRALYVALNGDRKPAQPNHD